MPAAQKKTALQISKPKPTLDEKRVIEAGEAPKEKRLIQLAVYMTPADVARLDKACGKGEGYGNARGVWIRNLVITELAKAGV